MPGRLIRNPRYSFVILAALSLVFAFGATMISLKAINDSQHKWCQVVTTITAIPVPKPVHPDSDLSRERAYEFYNEFVDLKRSLGC